MFGDHCFASGAAARCAGHGDGVFGGAGAALRIHDEVRDADDQRHPARIHQGLQGRVGEGDQRPHQGRGLSRRTTRRRAAADAKACGSAPSKLPSAQLELFVGVDRASRLWPWPVCSRIASRRAARSTMPDMRKLIASVGDGRGLSTIGYTIYDMQMFNTKTPVNQAGRSSPTSAFACWRPTASRRWCARWVPTPCRCRYLRCYLPSSKARSTA